MKHDGTAQLRHLAQPASAFRERLCRAVELVGLGAVGMMPGCGESADDEGYRTTNSAVGIIAREPGFVPLTCSASEYPSPLYLMALQPSQPVDYLALRAGSFVVESSGTACGGATDPSTCLAALDALPEAPALDLGAASYVISAYHLVGTRGNEVLRVGALAELLAFLGEIDSVGDAQLLAATQGYDLVCGESGTLPTPSGYDVLGFTYQGCDGRTRYLLHVDTSGQTQVTDSFVERDPTPACIPGRRHEALPPRAPVRSSLGRYFAGCAELEAASVPAFLRLARELDAHRAPRSLVRRALRSARDEVRHARHVGALARRFGGSPRFQHIPVGRVRSLEHIALENAVEGCVNETYAALVALHQAAHSPEPAIAATHRAIATDEMRHADLAWDVARWVEPRLPASARRRIDQARRHRARALTRDLAHSTASAIDPVAGLPPPALALALAERLF